ncbi:hypothetical protein MtrunA17_Chr7g0231271 [Medicago truncatula]|uniref:Transmembrane protein n=1 Tax=Medicago truncatula TaxID=3880 RepID=A0A396H166_MEDTR|nr:hypothetical protein MtrunA17_Chr7g0231271 [Medicago truncatula]
MIPNAHTYPKIVLLLEHGCVHVAFNKLLIWWLPNCYLLLLILHRFSRSFPNFLPLEKLLARKLYRYVDWF